MNVQFPLHDPVLQFTLLVAAALVMQLTVERARLPGLLGLLVFGMLVGPGGFGVLPSEPVLSMLGEIGLIYVMFIAGIEIDLDLIGEHRAEAILFGVLAFVASALPAFGAALLLDFDAVAAVLIGTLVASHTLLAHPILLRLDLLRRLPVVTAVGGTLLTDTLALLVLAVVVSVHGADAGSLTWLLPMLLLAVLTAAALWLVPRLSRYFFARHWVSGPERALYALVVLLVLAVTAELIGTDEILGAFLAGICLNRTLGEREQLREHIEFVGRMLFIPFFFIWTGTLVELEVFTGQAHVWLLAGMLFAAVVIGKTSAAFITGARYGYAARDRLLMAAMTLPQAAATLAITITARELGLLGEDVVDAVVLVIVATCLLGPVVTRRVGEQIARETEREQEAEEPAMHERTDV